MKTETHPFDPTDKIEIEADIAIECKNCGSFFDSLGFEISPRKAYYDYEVIKGFCSDECKEVY